MILNAILAAPFLVLEFPLQLNFFGLNDEYIKSVFDQILDLKYYAGFSIFESYNLPIGLRNYYIQKIVEKLEKEKESMEKNSNKNK